MSASVHVRARSKTYGTFEAVKGVDFDICPGEVFGLLGPKGAGKTTTVEILEGLRPRSGGEVAVPGFDPCGESRRVKDRTGVSCRRRRSAESLALRGGGSAKASRSEAVSGCACPQRSVRLRPACSCR